MAFSVNLILDTRTINKDNTHTIALQVIVNRKVTTIATDYAVPAKHWDSKNKLIKNSSNIAGNITRVNNILQKERSTAFDKLTALYDAGQLDRLSIKEIRQRITSESNPSAVFRYTESIIQELNETGRIGNARIYGHMLKSIKTFTKEQDFTFSQLTFTWLKKYEQFYFSKEGNSINGFGVYVRTLRAVYNRAIKENIAKLEEYPFRSYTIAKEKTQKRALREDAIEKIRQKQLEPGTRIFLARDLFLTSFYLIGISFMDLAHLKLSAIREGRVHYKRKKTGQLHNIKITPKLQEILDRYTLNKKAEDYIFPIIKRESPELVYRDVKNSMKVYNKMLKDIAQRCELDEQITSYWSRHSWATIAKKKGVSTAVISESLGHTNEGTTQVYLDSFETETIDSANELVTHGG